MAFKVGNLVTLTPDGAKAHRSYHSNQNKLIGAGAGFIFAPVLIPSAGIGIAAGGAAIGVAEPVQSAVGGLIGAMAGALFGDEPEAGNTGKVLVVNQRWLGGWDVEVEWQLKNSEGKHYRKKCWHEGKHLICL
jgi:hypothetical protein